MTRGVARDGHDEFTRTDDPHAYDICVARVRQSWRTRVRRFSNFHVGPKRAKSWISGYIRAIVVYRYQLYCYTSKEFVYKCACLVSSQRTRMHREIMTIYKLIEIGDCLQYWGKCSFALFFRTSQILFSSILFFIFFLILLLYYWKIKMFVRYAFFLTKFFCQIYTEKILYYRHCICMCLKISTS